MYPEPALTASSGGDSTGLGSEAWAFVPPTPKTQLGNLTSGLGSVLFPPSSEVLHVWNVLQCRGHGQRHSLCATLGLGGFTGLTGSPCLVYQLASTTGRTGTLS